MSIYTDDFIGVYCYEFNKVRNINWDIKKIKGLLKFKGIDILSTSENSKSITIFISSKENKQVEIQTRVINLYPNVNMVCLYKKNNIINDEFMLKNEEIEKLKK